MKAFAQFLAHPRMMFWLLPWLMLILVLGTLAQRSIGLYAAEQHYFASWIVWLGGALPLPGMYPSLALLSVSLMAKLLFKSPWVPARMGVLVTHLGALLLLLGGLLTALGAEEGYLAASVGSRSNQVSDYHERELVVLKNGAPIWRVAHDTLRVGKAVSSAQLPFDIVPKMLCRNCVPDWREDSGQADKGLSQQVLLKALPLEKQDEANLAGMVFAIENSPQDDGRYFLFEPMQKRPSVKANGAVYELLLRKSVRTLPFTVHMEAFDKQVHPGTQMAREYESLVSIDEGDGVRWQSVIRMNEPLRVQGYTLYQASFEQRGEETISVLAVVKNAGRVFPYVASLVIGLGLLLHLYARRRPL